MVSKSFGAHVAVRDVSLRVPKGCIYGLLGPTGAGKTTIMRMAMGIFLPDSGSLRVLGNAHAWAVKDQLGYLPEERGLYKKMRAAEVVAYFGRLKGMPRGLANVRATELLRQFGLGDWVNERCSSLSKGMSQKVQLLTTLVHEPDLVILDEPFSGLDPVNMELLDELILEIKNQGRSVVLSTHRMGQAERLCDYICLIHKGAKVMDGRLTEVRRDDEHTLEVMFTGDGHALGAAQLDGVKLITVQGNMAELLLTDEAEVRSVVRSLIDLVPVRSFRVRTPSLHEVFVRTVEADVVL